MYESLIIYEARQRTALDGKIWWCVFNTDTMTWSTFTCFGRYKTKRACQCAINRYLMGC